MARKVFAWQCRYCGALKKNEKIAIRHENSCLKNPDAKNCLLCVHKYTHLDDNSIEDSGMFGMTVSSAWCHVKQCACSKAVSGNCTYFENMYEDGVK